MATVAMAVITGKRQNSHTIVSADRAKIAQSAAIRAFAESLMPDPPEPNADTPGYVIHPALLNGHTVKTPKDGEGLIDRVMGGLSQHRFAAPMPRGQRHQHQRDGERRRG